MWCWEGEHSVKEQYEPEHYPQYVGNEQGETHVKREAFSVLGLLDGKVLRNIRHHTADNHGYREGYAKGENKRKGYSRGQLAEKARKRLQQAKKKDSFSGNWSILDRNQSMVEFTCKKDKMN